MGELSFVERLREFLTSRRFLWILTIGFGAIVVLFFLFVTFLFNPFEADLEDMAQVVPREVDYFLRWQDAGARFGSFPEPAIWSEVESSSVYETLDAAGDIDRIGAETGIAAMLAELENATAQMPAGLSFKGDLLREIAVAGRGTPEMGRAFDGVLMLRVSFKVKAGFSMLGFGFVRDKLPEGFTPVDEGDGRYRVPQFQAFGGNDAWMMRMRDVLLIASREEWLETARTLLISSGQDSLGQASVFHDNVGAHLAPGDQPVEAFMRVDKALGGPVDWPGDRPTFMAGLLARFLAPAMVTNLAGYWLPSERFHGRISGALDPTSATDFQKRWLESRPLELRRIEQVASFLPADTFFLGGVSGDPSRVLPEMYNAVDDEARRFFDELVIEATDYQGVGHLFGEMGSVLSPGMFLALRRNDYPPGTNDPEHDDTPVPVGIFIGLLRDQSAEEDYAFYIDFFQKNANALSRGGPAAKAQEVTLHGNTKTTAFASPAISGTGEILVWKMELDRKPYVFLSNSYNYANQMLQVMFKDKGSGLKLVERDGFKRTMDEIQRTGANMFAYFEPSEARQLLDDRAELGALDEFRMSMEAQYRSRRPEVEARVREELYPGRSTLRPEEINTLANRVDDELDKLFIGQRDQQVPLLAENLRRQILPLQWLDWFSMVARVTRRTAEVAVSGALDLD